jgi:hypothetical protein
MPTEHIITLLIQERDRLNRAIEALQGPAKRRGRPPKNLALSTIEAGQPKKKRHVSAAARRKMAAAQKKRWAAVKASK